MSKALNMTKNCEWCEVSFKVTPTMLRVGRRCCSHKCSKASLWSKAQYVEKMSLAHKGNIPTNILCLIENSKLTHGNREKNLGKEAWNKGKKMPQITGENNYNWKRDRTALVVNDKKHLDGRYREWMRAIKNRDGWKCRISNGDCSGRLESHHILGWKSNPELRYEFNNGITLCAFHHPKKRDEVERLSPYFRELISK